MEHLITKEQKIQMLKNGLQTKKDHIGNHWPVVKLLPPTRVAPGYSRSLPPLTMILLLVFVTLA